MIPGQRGGPYPCLPGQTPPTRPVQELSEQELARRCQHEDRSAQEALYGRFARKMFAVCLRYARHRPEAEDLLQEGFIRVFDKLHTYRMEGSLEGWVRRIMVHTCINHLRKKSVRGELLGNAPGPERAEAPLALGKMGEQELLALVKQLPAGYRMVFNLFAIEGYEHTEIAALLGCNEGTSRSQLSKARRLLQRKLEHLNALEKNERTKTDR